MHPIYFLSQSTLLNIETACLRLLRDWIQSWCFIAPEITVSIYKNGTMGLISGDCQTSEDTPGGFSLLDDSDMSWEKVVFDNLSEEKPKDTISQAMINDAKHAFIQMFHSTLLDSKGKLTHRNIDDLKPGIKTKNIGDSFLILDISIGSHNLQLQFPVYNWIEKYRKPLSGTTHSLVPASSTIGKGEVTVTVEMDLGNYQIGLLRNLSIGDVLTSNISVDTPFKVTLGRKHVATAFLGKEKDNKAIYLQTNQP